MLKKSLVFKRFSYSFTNLKRNTYDRFADDRARFIGWHDMCLMTGTIKKAGETRSHW